MISICEAFSEEYGILFNPSKSKLIYFHAAHADLIIIYRCGQPANIVQCETYFGNYIGTNICDTSI